MKTGIAVVTYGSVPYIDLQLHYLTQVGADRVVVIDDNSDDPALYDVCRKYGVDLRSTPARMGWQAGDLQSYADILHWACRYDLDLVVKVSRRWIITADGKWLQDLQGIREKSRGITFSSYSTAWNMPFRTECLGLWVKPWMSKVTEIEDTAQKYKNGMQDMLVEGYMHKLAKDLAGMYWVGPETREYRETMARNNHHGYAAWTKILGTSRNDKVDGVVNHWTHKPEDFKVLADSHGLVYPLELWETPNKDH